jgi:hypothetical protein
MALATPSLVTKYPAYPDDVMLQDGAEPYDVVVEQVHGEEKALWWDRAVSA